MWSKETIEKELKENKLPCAKCKKWKEYTQFEKTDKLRKTCQDCRETIRQKQLEHTAIDKTLNFEEQSTCVIL
jgi:hypothetical protein